MSHERPVITLSPNVTTAIMDAVQRAIIDRGASRATRKAAFSALIALADAGLLKGVRPVNGRHETVVTDWLVTNHRDASRFPEDDGLPVSGRRARSLA